TQETVIGEVTVELYKGNVRILSRNSPYSLYNKDLATYTIEDKFDHSAAEGFLHLYGLPYKTWGQVTKNAKKEGK
ncbi:MAG: argininosuccinate synthase, partial [Bacteroidota bacterium]